MTCGDSTPPPPPCQDPRGFSATPEASRPPSSSLTLGESWATPEALRPPSSPRTPKVSLVRFSLQPPCPPLCANLAPWRPRAPASSAAVEEAFPVLPPPTRASPCRSPATISCVPHAVAVRFSLPHSSPPRVRRLLLRCWFLQFPHTLADPLLSRVVAPLLAFPPHVVLSPVTVTAYLVLVPRLAPSSRRLLCRRPPPLSRSPLPRLFLVA